MSIEAMKQALDAFEEIYCLWPAEQVVSKARETLRAAIAEASMQRLTDVQQEMDCYGDGNVYRGQRSSDSQAQTIRVKHEPGAWHHPDCEDACIACLIEREVEESYGTQGLSYLRRHVVAPLRREWVGLTDEEIAKLHYATEAQFMGTFKIEDIYHAIEAKLKEKNS